MLTTPHFDLVVDHADPTEGVAMKLFLIKLLRAINFRTSWAIERLQLSKNKVMSNNPPALEGKASLVITTFSDRFFEYAIPTLRSLRAAGVDREIFLVVNGDQSGRYDAASRMRFLSEALAEIDVNPVCFGAGRGMSEMWNMGARAAGTEKLIFLGEDLLIDSNNALSAIVALEDELERSPLVILNGSFGHFGTLRSALVKVGWFDERFLGFGQEDGDYSWRIRDAYPESEIKWINHPGLNNISSNLGYKFIKANTSNKYSVFNNAFLRVKYKFSTEDLKNGFSASPKLAISEESRYPEQGFRDKFEYLLNEEDEGVITDTLRRSLDSEAK
jgi:hypothetical protein